MSIVQNAIVIIPVITAVTVFIPPVTAGIAAAAASRKKEVDAKDDFMSQRARCFCCGEQRGCVDLTLHRLERAQEKPGDPRRRCSTPCKRSLVRSKVQEFPTQGCKKDGQDATILFVSPCNHHSFVPMHFSEQRELIFLYRRDKNPELSSLKWRITMARVTSPCAGMLLQKLPRSTLRFPRIKSPQPRLDPCSDYV